MKISYYEIQESSVEEIMKQLENKQKSPENQIFVKKIRKVISLKSSDNPFKISLDSLNEKVEVPLSQNCFKFEEMESFFKEENTLENMFYIQNQAQKINFEEQLRFYIKEDSKIEKEHYNLFEYIEEDNIFKELMNFN